MKIELEPFSLRHMVPQLRELNDNVYSIKRWTNTYFWLDPPLKNKYTRFKFVFKALVSEKLTNVFKDLTYDKNFIIRYNGKFVGMVSLIEVCQNIPATELGQFEIWAPRTKLALLLNFQDYTIDTDRKIASVAVDKAEEYARSKSVGYLRVKTSPKNTIANQFFGDKSYVVHPVRDLDGVLCEYDWVKKLNKTVEKKHRGR